MTLREHPAETHLETLEFYIPDDVLLEARLCDLGLKLEDSNYLTYSQKLAKELASAGLAAIKPKYYLADEWFCPEASISIAIPFWLAHPRLKKLESAMMGFVEGETKEEFMKLLRHEAGHCVEHAYHLSKRSDWKNIFGNPSQKYTPENYAWNPHSRDFVRHLPDGYAQAHPEEDFAETFAVWLNPKAQWQKRYFGWDGAMAKLRYVDALIKEISHREPKNLTTKMIASTTHTRKTLREIYRMRLRERGRVQMKRPMPIS